MDLAILWAGLLAFAVFAYVVLDGFDLGIGILFPAYAPGAQRDQMMNSVAPVWDGNETWLVLGGGGLYAAFPLAYAVLMPALYAPIIAMLLGLVFRGVAFEYRWRSIRYRKLWDWAFFSGSFVASLAQGIALGAIIQGVQVEARGYAGGWWDWLTPFTVVTGISLVVGYVMLGASWLVLKTEAEIALKARKIAVVSLVATVVLLGIVSIWTPFLHENYFHRWFGFPSAFGAPLVPILIGLLLWWFYRGLHEHHDAYPFLAALGIFAVSFGGILFTIFPDIVPHGVTIARAAAPDSSLKFMLVGSAVLIPLILAYTAYAYWVFRGKVDPEGGYH